MQSNMFKINQNIVSQYFKPLFDGPAQFTSVDGIDVIGRLKNNSIHALDKIKHHDAMTGRFKL